MHRFAADPESHFAGYTQPETMPKHAAPKPTWLDRMRSWWRKVTHRG